MLLMVWNGLGLTVGVRRDPACRFSATERSFFHNATLAQEERLPHPKNASPGAIVVLRLEAHHQLEPVELLQAVDWSYCIVCTR